MADEGASTPVARAIATGNASATAHGTAWSGVLVMVPDGCTGAVMPLISTAAVIAMNASVMIANRARPRCPNQVRPATRAVSARASGIRHGASAGT